MITKNAISKQEEEGGGEEGEEDKKKKKDLKSVYITTLAESYDGKDGNEEEERKSENWEDDQWRGEGRDLEITGLSRIDHLVLG